MESIRSFFFAAIAFAGSSHVVRAAEPLHVHIISGSGEYRSEASLKPFAETLTRDHGIEVTASWVKDGAKSLPDFGRIRDADVLLVFARRLKLPEDQMAPIRAHWEAGKGVVGIRTASHAFGDADNKIFDREVMGGNYKGHFGAEAVEVSVTDEGRKHPVLTGVGEIGSKKLYKAAELGSKAVPLQHGVIGLKDGKQATHPVTWAHPYKGGNMLYTSLGVPSDFEDPDFVRMLVNAIFWTAGKPVPATP